MNEGGESSPMRVIASSTGNSIPFPRTARTSTRRPIFPPDASTAELALEDGHETAEAVLEDEVGGPGADDVGGGFLPDGARDDDEGDVEVERQEEVQRRARGECGHGPVGENDVP